MTNINWDGDAESAPFKSRFDDESENLILAETDTGTALFEWDGSAWQFRGPVEMNGEDLSGIGTLTATSGNFDSVNTAQLNTPPTGVLVSLESDQDIDTDDETRLEWESETPRGEVSNLLDPTNNVVEIPEGFSWASVNVMFRAESSMTLERLQLERNGQTTITPGWGAPFGWDFTVQSFGFNFGWASVDQGDTIAATLNHTSGSSRTIDSSTERTFMQIWLL